MKERYTIFMSPFLNPTYIISILIALSIHEWAHAVTADRLGDPTPGRAGRLTLNPIAHLDLLGAILFLTVGFGWAKPVPVDSSYFKHPKRGLSLVAVAGPLSNLILAIIAFISLSLLTGGDAFSAMSLLEAPQGAVGYTVLLQILQSSLFVNLALMAFNLFPVAPLDGSNIVQMFVPYQYERQYEDFVRMGPYILLGLILFESFLPIQILSGWVYGIIGFVLSVFDFVSALV